MRWWGGATAGRVTAPAMRVLAVAFSVVALVAGCGTDQDRSEGDGTPAPRSQGPLRPETSPPDDDVTVVATEAPVALAIGASRALYDRAAVVYLAGEDDPAGQRAGAASATARGVPLLLTPVDEQPSVGETPPTGEPSLAGEPPSPAGPSPAEPPDTGAGGAIREELARLGTVAVATSGEAAAGWVNRHAAQLSGITAVPGGIADALPTVVAPEPLTGVAVLAPEADHTVAALATARAAGARVLVTAHTDPRTDPALIEALADSPPGRTVALGAGFGPADRLRDRLAVAATGVQLPGGGQVLFPGRRFVALYGHPGAPVLGVLGEQPVEEAVERARRVAAEYESLVDEPVVPAFEIITTIASGSAGPERDYSRRTPVDQLRPWVDAAREAGVYVVLDLQPGRTDFLSQAREYEQLLREPHVGLALDPEWRLRPDQRHLEQIGSVDAAEVNRVVDWLADLTAAHHLPQKLLVLHQFTLRMITHRPEVRTGRDELAVLIHVDGFGTPSAKRNTWDALHVDPPPDVWWGWKNFYDEDRPTFTPEQTLRVSPAPVFISYQ